MHVRRLITATAVAAVATVGLAVPATTVSAVELSCDDPVAVQTALDAAKADRVAARKAFVASNRPLGRLLKETRREARQDVRESRVALRGLVREARTAETREERRELRLQIRAERRDLRDSRRMLDSKRALLAETRAMKRAARADFREARVALRDVRGFAATCDEVEPGATPEPTQESTTSA